MGGQRPRYKDVLNRHLKAAEIVTNTPIQRRPQSASHICRDRYQHPNTKTSSIGISKLQRSIPTPQYKDVLNRHLKAAEIDTNTPIQRRPQSASQSCRDRYQHPNTKTSSIGISKLQRSIPTPNTKTSSIGISKLQRSIPTPQYKDVLNRHLTSAEIYTNTPIQRRPQSASQSCRDRYQHPNTKTSSIGISKLQRSIPTP